MEVKYVDHMGTDLSVVNAARVSFAKTSDTLDERDKGLIRYLATHKHWTPFGHAAVTLHMKLPMFVQRQIDKHQVGFVVNEVSRRYVDDEPEFYQPDVWRSRPTGGIKQGSGEDEVLMIPNGLAEQTTQEGYNKVTTLCRWIYQGMIKAGVAPELARMVLPMSMYTESWKTGSLYAWANLYNLRIDPHAQKETQEVARMVGEIIEPLFPEAWKALTTS